MCGFGGFFNSSRNQKFSQRSKDALLKKMSKTILRRGPDSEYFFHDSQLQMVFRRLTINDHLHGDQPFSNRDGSIYVFGNGEIYNHQELRSKYCPHFKFRGQSDIEVILPLFEKMGTRAFSLLNGEFALVIWEPKVQRLTLVRDRMGIRPLFYTRGRGQLSEPLDELIFSSELKTLLVHPSCPREFAWNDLTNWYQPVSHIKNVQSLPPGHFVTIDQKGIIDCPYWCFENYFHQYLKKPGIQQVSQLVKNYAEIFQDSISLRWPKQGTVGISLSGGLDSAMILAAGSKINKNTVAFTLADSSTVERGDLEQAQKLTKLLKVPHEVLNFDFTKRKYTQVFNLEFLENLIATIEMPTFDYQWPLKNILMQSIRNHHPELKILFSGQGADEFAGGYSRREDRPFKNWQQFEQQILKPNWVEGLHRRVGLPKYLAHLIEPESNPFFKEQSFSQSMLYFNYFKLQNHNIWHEDRNSSSFGFEQRTPFLDHRLVEFLIGTPPAMHGFLLWDKKLQRMAAQNWLPSSFANQPKGNFFLAQSAVKFHQFQIQVLKNIFPSFLKKYHKDLRLPISLIQLNDWYRMALNGDPGSKTFYGHKVLSAMTLEIFFKIFHLN